MKQPRTQAQPQHEASKDQDIIDILMGEWRQKYTPTTGSEEDDNDGKPSEGERMIEQSQMPQKRRTYENEQGKHGTTKTGNDNKETTHTKGARTANSRIDS